MISRHERCKYFYVAKKNKTKRVYSSMHKNDVDIDYEESVCKCGLNPSAVTLDNEQPLCKDFKGVE